MIRIAFLTGHFLPQLGGIQVLLDKLSRGLAKEWDFSVSAFTRTWEDRPHCETIGATRVWRTPTLGKREPVKLTYELLRWLRRYPTDALICVEPRLRLSLPGIVATKLLGIPMALLLTGTFSETSFRLSRWIAGAGAKRIVGISNYAIDRFGYWPSRSQMIYAGVDPALPSALPSFQLREQIVLTVARVNPRKNLEMVIQVAPMLPAYQFVIIGGYSSRTKYYNSLLTLRDELGASNVRFVGEVSESQKQEYLKRARLFFLPTRHEMFGIVFGEAMAHGLPIVATDTAAVPEVVTPDVGRLCLLSSPPEAFAAVIAGLLDDENTWNSMSANCLERARLFQWDNIVGEYARLFARLTNKELARAH